jgi:hypothetical protein
VAGAAGGGSAGGVGEEEGGQYANLLAAWGTSRYLPMSMDGGAAGALTLSLTPPAG